jgi:hypothetical protein
MRDFRYLIVTPIVGALAGAVFGLVSLAVVGLLVDGLGGFPVVWDAYTFVAVVGAAVGAISLPVVSWWIVRHVPLERVVAETGLATVIGSIAGSLVSHLNPVVGLASAFLGFCLGATQLRLRRPPSEAISRSPYAA